MDQLKMFLSDDIPEWAKDVRLSFETIDRNPTFGDDKVVAWGAALAAALSAQNVRLAHEITSFIEREYREEGTKQIHGARVAAGLMAMTNYYYSFKKFANNEDVAKMPPGLRMQAYASHGGVSAKNFEIYALSASIVGKCEGCVSGHVQTLIEKEGASEKEIQEIGRIASIVGAAAKVMVFAGS